MKTLIAAIFAATLIAGAAAPTMAQQTIDNCVFKEQSLCVTESLSPTTGEDDAEPVQNVT